MPTTKAHRASSSSRLAPHSRTNSATRLGTNLQFTQKDPTNRQPQQPAPSRKSHTHDKIPRVSSFHRADSLQPTAKRVVHPTKVKKGFTLASSPSDEADDDEWVSSESGAATPNPESEPEMPAEQPEPPTPIPRVDTARVPLDSLPRAKLSGVPKRTRPPSMHSISTKHDVLRPHPLIRGQSFGLPIAPLATTSDVSAQISSTPPPANIDIHSSLSTSPTTTISGSPSSLHHMPSRRTSISSARSVATLPAPRQPKDRTRTVSMLSTSSSSAAISSLAHIPATRPPSPQRLSVIFPPPSHPQFHTAGVHSLLPPPYLSNHLATLAHRTPLRESYDRISRAKLEARR